jgi:formate dehydrogenase major subunit
MAAGVAAKPVDRRSFLRASGLTVGGIAALGTLGAGTVRRAEAGPVNHAQPIEIKTNICTHCSVGCTVKAEVQNGVWVGQEPAWASPINRGTHCAKGASGARACAWRPPAEVSDEEGRAANGSGSAGTRPSTRSATRCRDPRPIRAQTASTLLGSAKFSNEGAYLFRKFAAFWGTNNVDHQARICHSTTVAGVANTWGYGAQTNSYNDIRNSKTVIFMGSNAAEAHPVSLQHILEGKETQRANVIVIDPRFTRTAAHATEYVRFRPGTDIAVIWGMLWHIFENGWEDTEFLAQRVWGMDQVRAKWRSITPAVVERITGIKEAELRRVAETFATQSRRPSSGAWAARSTPSARRTCAPTATSCWRRATSGRRYWREHLPRPLQRAGRHGLRARCREPARLLRACGRGVAALGARLGRALRILRGAASMRCRRRAVATRARRKQNMAVPGITSTRWFDATLLDAGRGRPARQHQGDDRLRPWRQHRPADAGRAAGHERAGPACGRRPASHDLRGAA